MNKIELINGDCLEEMDKLIEDGVVVDAIICDPPYGTTDKNKWDKIIPIDEMWLRLNKLIKPNGAIILFGQDPFSSLIRVENIKNYRYDIIWEKSKPVGFFNAKKMPLRTYENISVFYKKLPTYNYHLFTEQCNRKVERPDESGVYGARISRKNKYISKEKNFPRDIVRFSNKDSGSLHPTQKPVALMEYLIKTYTNENELVLDFTMGSGTTMLACKNLNRRGIGIELDKNYFKIAQDRIYDKESLFG